MKIKTASDLKWHVEQSGSNPYFFTRSTMQFFGDTMRNYGVRGPFTVETCNGPVVAYELYRRRAVKHNLQDSHYFNAETFDRVFLKKD